MLLAAHKCLAIRPVPLNGRLLKAGTEPRGWPWRGTRDYPAPALDRSASLSDEPSPDNLSSETATLLTRVEATRAEPTQVGLTQVESVQVEPATQEQEIDPFYLFACYIEWERGEDTSAAWELLAAAQSSHGNTQAHARALLAASRHLGGITAAPATEGSRQRSRS